METPPNADPVTDHVLMQRVASLDATAYRQLVDRHLNACLRTAERMLGNRQDAEEVAQDACLKLWHEAPRWEPRAKVSTWLYRVVFNGCIDYKRRRKSFAVIAAEELPDPAAGAEAQLAGKQRAGRVRAALGKLPERQRAAVILSYYEGLSNQEAAEAMDMKLNAFQQLLFRARTSLKDELKEYLREKDLGSQTG